MSAFSKFLVLIFYYYIKEKSKDVDYNLTSNIEPEQISNVFKKWLKTSAAQKVFWYIIRLLFGNITNDYLSIGIFNSML